MKANLSTNLGPNSRLFLEVSGIPIECLCENTRFKRQVPGRRGSKAVHAVAGKGCGLLAAVEPGSAPEPGGDRLGFLEIAVQHRQGVAGVFSQPRVLTGLRLGR